MIRSVNDALKLNIACTQCSHTFEESLSWLKLNSDLACPSCGQQLKVRIESGGVIERMGGIADQFEQTLARFREPLNRDDQRR